MSHPFYKFSVHFEEIFSQHLLKWTVISLQKHHPLSYEFIRKFLFISRSTNLVGMFILSVHMQFDVGGWWTVEGAALPALENAPEQSLWFLSFTHILEWGMCLISPAQSGQEIGLMVRKSECSLAKY